MDGRMLPAMAEANRVYFAQHLKPPKLLVNGRNDEENVWLTRGLPLWNPLREPKKLALVDGAGVRASPHKSSQRRARGIA